MAETTSQAPEQTEVAGDNTPATEAQAPKKKAKGPAKIGPNGRLVTMHGVSMYVKG